MDPPLDMPALNCYGPIAPPSSSVSISSGYELFGDCSLDPVVDFSRDNRFIDDPTLSIDGVLMGPDGEGLRRFSVQDADVRNGVSESVNSTVTFSLLPYSASAGTHLSSVDGAHYIAADSGTEYNILTLATANQWKGRAVAQMHFVGAFGSPFPVFGGDDLLVETQDCCGTWRLLNLGKTFVSPYANLNLASSHEMQLRELGTVFEIDGSAYLVDKNGFTYPLVRKNGLWQFLVRFPSVDYGPGKTAYQASIEAASDAHVGSHVPGAFANISCSCNSCNFSSVPGLALDPTVAFARAASGCTCPGSVDTSFSCGAGADFLVQGIELSLPDNLKIGDDDMAKVLQKVANMKKYHILFNHPTVEVLNQYVRDGIIQDGIILQSCSCDACDASKLSKSPVSKKHSKSYDPHPFHVIQGDIFDAEDVVAREGDHYVLAFIDVVTGCVFQYFMRSKFEALDGFKAFERWLELESPKIEKKWGRPPKVSCVAFDREGSLTTTYGGMASVADKYFIEKGYNRLVTSRGASNGCEKIERYFKSLKGGVRTQLLTAGFTDWMWFDAAHVFCYHYNRLRTKANRVSDSESPYESLGLKFDAKSLRIFGSMGHRLNKRKLLTAADFPGDACIFIGYGTDTPGYRVVIPEGSHMCVDVDKDVVINSSLLKTKAFVARCRSDPLCSHMLSWIDLMFRPTDILSIRSEVGSDVESFPGLPSSDEPVHDGFSQSQLDMLGRPVVKLFDPGDGGDIREYEGRVISIDHNKDSGDVMFEILYNDGDREDVDFEELDSLVQAYARKIFLKSQTVGANPQVQSRLGLKEHMEPVNSKCMCSPTEAKRAISEARRKDQIMVFNRDNPETPGTKSYWRLYPPAPSFKGFFLDRDCLYSKS